MARKIGDDAIMVCSAAYHIAEVTTMVRDAGQRPVCLKGKANDALFDVKIDPLWKVEDSLAVRCHAHQLAADIAAKLKSCCRGTLNWLVDVCI